MWKISRRMALALERCLRGREDTLAPNQKSTMKPLRGVGLVVMLIFAGLPMTQAQQRDLAAGAGELVAGDTNVTFGFAASSGGGGENPRGHITIDWGDGAAQYTVECMAVSNNRALVGGSGPAGNIAIYVEDNGEPGAGADRVLIHFGATCAGPFIDAEPAAITRGNIQVQDAPALDR